ncbi:MAG: hypothetical protein IJ570_07780 [Prevotella sp.]|nr:hypothetical protein [Prevotella sp.]
MRHATLLIALLWACLAAGQTTLQTGSPADAWPPKQKVPDGWPTLRSFSKNFSHAFSHLDLSVTAGTTGIGVDASTTLNDVLSLRVGYAIMPRFSYRMHFGVEVGDDPETSEAKFNRLSGLLADFTGNKVDNVVDVDGTPTYWNWKLLVDVKPFRNKHWHLTGGLYYGSHEVARAVNAIEDMPSMMAVSIYNNLYNRALNNDLSFELITGASNDDDDDEGGNTKVYLEKLAQKLKDYGKMSIHMGEWAHDVYYDEDEYIVAPEGGIALWSEEENMEVLYPEGTVVCLHHKGDLKHAKGDAYRMTPDENSMVKAWALANRFKPYVGFGYGGRLLKSDPRWEISFDCGAMFWGGVPKIVTHDGTDLVNDVVNVRGKVGDYVEVIKKFKVFPVLNLRITRRLF